MKCLEKNPKQRYQQTQDLTQDLDSFLKGKPISAKKPNRIFFLTKKILKKYGLSLIFFSNFLLLTYIALFFSTRYVANNLHLAESKLIQNYKGRTFYAKRNQRTDKSSIGENRLESKNLEIRESRNPEELWKKGSIFLSLKEWNKSETIFRAALENQPDHFPSHIGLAKSLEGLDRKEEALTQWLKAQRLGPFHKDKKTLYSFHPPPLWKKTHQNKMIVYKSPQGRGLLGVRLVSKPKGMTLGQLMNKLYRSTGWKAKIISSETSIQQGRRILTQTVDIESQGDVLKARTLLVDNKNQAILLNGYSDPAFFEQYLPFYNEAIDSFQLH